MKRARILGVLATLEEVVMNIDARDFEAMTPKALQATKAKLPHNWMVWEYFVIAYYLSRSGQHYRHHETCRERVTLLNFIIQIIFRTVLEGA